MSYFYNYTNITLIIFSGKMVRSRGRDGSIIRRGQPRRRDLAIDLGRIPFSGLSPSSDGSPHGSHSSTPSSSYPSSSTHSSNPSSSIPSSSHHAFTLSRPPSTLSAYHPYVPSPPHPPVSDPLIPTLSPYVPAHPVSYTDIAHHIAALPGRSSFVPYVYHTSTAPLHPSFTSPPQPTPAPLSPSFVPPFVPHTSPPSVQAPGDDGDHATATTSDHELPTQEPQYDPSGRVTVKSLDKG